MSAGSPLQTPRPGSHLRGGPQHVKCISTVMHSRARACMQVQEQSSHILAPSPPPSHSSSWPPRGSRGRVGQEWQANEHTVAGGESLRNAANSNHRGTPSPQPHSPFLTGTAVRPTTSASTTRVARKVPAEAIFPRVSHWQLSTASTCKYEGDYFGLCVLRPHNCRKAWHRP